MAVWDDMRVKPHVRAAAQEISRVFGISNIGGFATTGHVSNSDHYTGHALDVMTSARGPQVAEWAIANAARLSIKYIIWNRRIWEPSSGWKPYSGSSPHTDHVHLSFNTTPGDGSATTQGFSMPSGNSDAAGCLGALLSAFGWK